MYGVIISSCQSAIASSQQVENVQVTTEAHSGVAPIFVNESGRGTSYTLVPSHPQSLTAQEKIVLSLSVELI